MCHSREKRFGRLNSQGCQEAASEEPVTLLRCLVSNIYAAGGKRQGLNKLGDEEETHTEGACILSD